MGLDERDDQHHDRTAATALVLLGCAFLALVPMLLHSFSCGNDLTFHMQSWMEAARHWRQGSVLPQWAASAAWGAGEPRFVFYPPLSWMLGGALGAVFGWSAAPYAYCFVVLLLAGATSYRLARLYLPAGASLACAALYVTNPYTLFVIYTRAALAELLAAAILPWLIREALARRIRYHWFALAVCAMWLSNAPAAVIAMYSVAVLALARAVFERDWRIPFRQLAAVALGLALSGFYLVPAAYERRWVSINRVIGGAYDFHANFLFGGMGDPLHDLLLRHVSWIAVLLLVVAVVAVGFARERRALRPLVITLAVAAFLMVPVSAFAWSHLPQLRFLQFPWRWLTVVAVIYAVCAAAAMTRIARAARIAVALSVTVVCVWASYAKLRQACDPEDTPAGIRAQFESGKGFEATDEYEPIGAEDDDLRPDPDHPGYPAVWLYRADNDADRAGPPQDHVRMLAPVTVESWEAEYRRFRVETQIPSVAILQLRDYPGWRVRVDGAEAHRLPPASSGQMQIALPPGAHLVLVEYRRTRDAWLGAALSLLALLVLFAIPATRKPPHAHPDQAAPQLT